MLSCSCQHWKTSNIEEVKIAICNFSNFILSFFHSEFFPRSLDMLIEFLLKLKQTQWVFCPSPLTFIPLIEECASGSGEYLSANCRQSSECVFFYLLLIVCDDDKENVYKMLKRNYSYHDWKIEDRLLVLFHSAHTQKTAGEGETKAKQELENFMMKLIIWHFDNSHFSNQNI